MQFSHLGFDAAFDQTGAESRRQAPVRLVLAHFVFVVALTAIPIEQMTLWATVAGAAELILGVSTGARWRFGPVELQRVVRLLGTTLGTFAWTSLALMWWFSGSQDGKAAAVAVLAGIMIYVVRGCHQSLIHLIATGAWPMLALAALPFTDDLTAAVGLAGPVALLIIFAVSSAVRSWKAHRVLLQTSEALERKRQEAEAAAVSKSEFLANMSHEIRTPLNGIVAMAHLLNEAGLPAREREAARMICDSGAVLERLMSDILDLAKIESGKLELETAAFHLGDTVRGIGALCALKAQEKGVALSVRVAPDVDHAVEGDAVRVRQVLTNLVSNAVKFTDSGSVSVEAAPAADGAIRFTVADTGIGFDPVTKAQLFERFRQADGTITRRFGGTGLGLAISRDLVERMGGTLDCESTPGEGSRFWFEIRLPAAVSAQAPAAAAEPAGPDRALKVLVADDHPTNRKVVELILAGAGIEVVAAENGKDALDRAREQAFDLILMDMQMPVMDGLTAVRLLRSEEAQSGARHTPVLMLTANAMAGHIEAGRAAGADAHLAKPITPASLLAAVSAWTADTPAAAAISTAAA
jgi:signal transduction histidine kinase/ActR/RegA family two-component response regulator